MVYIVTSKTRREGRHRDGSRRKPHGETVVMQSKDDMDGFWVGDERAAEKRLHRNRRDYLDPKEIPPSADKQIENMLKEHS